MTGIYSNAFGMGFLPSVMPGAGMCSQGLSASPLAANESASIWGDPHITAANGGKYDFQNAGIFNLLSDQGINLNAQITQNQGSSVAYDTSAGLMLGSDTLQFDGDGNVMIGYDGNTPVSVNLTDGQSYTLGPFGSITRKGDAYTVDSPEYKVKVDTNKQDGDNGLKYLNIKVSSGGSGVDADGVAPTGLLGETFNGSSTQQTAPVNAASSYEVSNLFALPTSSDSQVQPLENTNSSYSGYTPDYTATASVVDPTAYEQSAGQPVLTDPSQSGYSTGYSDPSSIADSALGYGNYGYAQPTTLDSTLIDPTGSAYGYPQYGTTDSSYNTPTDYSQGYTQPNTVDPSSTDGYAQSGTVDPSSVYGASQPTTTDPSSYAYAQPTTTDPALATTGSQVSGQSEIGMMMEMLVQTMQLMMQMFQAMGLTAQAQ